MNAVPQDTSHDLRSFFRNVGHFVGERSLITAPSERPVPDETVELLDQENHRVSAQPLDVLGFADGVQSALTVTWRDHRPVYLTYAAAGCVGEKGKLLAVRERLDIVASPLDAEWIQALDTTIPALFVGAERPDEIERLALSRLGADRELLEMQLIEDLADRSGVLVLDGSIALRPARESIVGVVKTTRRRWLTDESFLWRLPVGWRSPRFKIHAGNMGTPQPRYSCYLRLSDASNRGWDYGLVRLEAWNPEQLDALAARCLLERQHAKSGDQRGDRHLAAMRVCETVLRARRPEVFTL